MNIVTEKISQTWQPADVESIHFIASLARKYTDESLAFAVFRSGTVVFSDSEEYEGDEIFMGNFAEFTKYPPDSNLLIMNDGNFVVKFLNTIRGIVLKDFYYLNRTEIVKNIETNGMMSGEYLFEDGGEPMRGDRYYIAMYARAKIFKDILNPEIVCRFDAKKGIDVS